MNRTLFEATRDMHHACEAHPVGQRMASGAITPQAWATWLGAFRVLHQVIDVTLPTHMARDAALAADLATLPAPRPSRAALTFAAYLAGADTTEGAAYVLHGAHLSGGRVLAPRMAKRGLPSLHVVYADHGAARAVLTGWRTRADLERQARETFATLLAVMDEIEGKA